MNYSNPLQSLMQLSQQQGQNPLQQLMQMGGKRMNYQPINHDQFIQGASSMNKEALASLVGQARNQGISEEDIKNGLDFLLQFRK